MALKTGNTFWKSSLQTLAKLRHAFDGSHPQRFILSPIFNNSRIGDINLRGNRNWANIHNKGLLMSNYAALRNEDMKVVNVMENDRITFTETRELMAKARVRNPDNFFYLYNSLLTAIKNGWERINKNITFRNVYPSFSNFICKQKGTKRFRRLIPNQNTKPQNFQRS